ncbi:MAG: helix-turn-helix transcriptional regulator [Deltaproteobacteria bacterium]|nr:helix-turn-helix transcriptional regulator [Deltaproteobacteria bacterium]
MNPSKEEIEQFINALQLSIKSRVARWKIAEPYLLIDFDRAPTDDKLEVFLSLVCNELGYVGERTEYRKTKFVNSENNVALLLKEITPLLTQFLLSSRLEKKNMEKLAEIDPQCRVFVQRSGLGLAESPVLQETVVQNTSDASRMVFAKCREMSMTLRTLSEKTGLSAMTLNKFKKGGDIRLSNLVKLCGAVGLTLKVGG